MTDLNHLIGLMGTMNVDSDEPCAIMCELTSRLAWTTLDSNRQNRRVAYYYALNLAEVPSTFTALSLSDLENPRIQSVLTRYAHWFDAEDTQLLYATLPDDAWELETLSRAMVGSIVKRA